jgi:hypothetical protein
MDAYLVRLAANKEIVGLFVSPNYEVLIDQIDECCDPYLTEVLELSTGGLYLGSAGAPRVPTAERYPEDNIPDWFAGATISELWLDAFFDKGDWEPVEPSS